MSTKTMVWILGVVLLGGAIILAIAGSGPVREFLIATAVFVFMIGAGNWLSPGGRRGQASGRERQDRP